ncbi:MAG: hypothetical protein LBT79_02150, partial [Elusimicrobiota bacterium]|nr:hypothetical protein [Elusimicrobiota bacterium]
KTKLKGIVFKGYKSDYSFLSKKFSLFFPKWHDESDGRKCYQPWHLLLDANGNTGFCCRMQPFLNSGKCPNVFNDGENIVNSSKAVAIRNALLNPQLPLEKECVNCAYMNSYGSDI